MTFEVDQWLYTLSDLRPNEFGRLYVPQLVGPRDACYIMEIRDRVVNLGLLSSGPPAPQDLFVLATGEPAKRCSTKIGGIPYWRADRPWPVNASGVPIPFLAQFDLRESMDVVPDRPGDIILFFAFSDLRLGAAVRVQDRCEADLLIASHELPVHSSYPTYTGVRWRVDVFPNWLPRDGKSWSTCYLDDGSRVSNVFMAMQPCAVQIGNYPDFPPPREEIVQTNERIVCTMPSITLMPDKAYPFLNRTVPLTPAEAEAHSIVLTDVDDRTDGILYAVETVDGCLDLRFRL